jgi:cytochrome c oxidase cbb3-type subunit 2
MVDGELIADKMRVLRILNTPYTDEDIANAPASVEGKTEMDALIAYLQVLGIHVSTRR